MYHQFLQFIQKNFECSYLNRETVGFWTSWDRVGEILGGREFGESPFLFPYEENWHFFKASQNYTVIQMEHDYSALCFIWNMTIMPQKILNILSKFKSV